MPPFARNPNTSPEVTVQNIPCRHPHPDRPAAGLHVCTRAVANLVRQRRGTAGSGNCPADRPTADQYADDSSNAASACRDRYTRTDGYGDPRADLDNRTGANCHANAAGGDCGAHGDTYCRATYTHAVANLTASLTGGHGNNHHPYTGVARHGVCHPFESPRPRPPQLEHWTDADGDCQDARQEVLVAESRTEPAFRTDKKCRVTAGAWLVLYTGAVVTDPSKLDIDHMVPLGNAHVSGASSWSANQRERYANYLDDPQHLIAVTASANRSKGARGPEEWEPEDRSYWCQYAVDWITIKDDWGLTVTQPEHDALVEMLHTCAKRPQLTVSHQSPASPTPVPTSWPATLTPQVRTYANCDAAQAASERRVQGSKGDSRGFPKWMVPSARDGDGDGIVCEK